MNWEGNAVQPARGFGARLLLLPFIVATQNRYKALPLDSLGQSSLKDTEIESKRIVSTEI